MDKWNKSTEIHKRIGEYEDAFKRIGNIKESKIGKSSK